MVHTITGKVIEIIRHTHSFDFTVRLDTLPEIGLPLVHEAQIAYAIENAEYRDEPHTFLLDDRGRIVSTVNA